MTRTLYIIGAGGHAKVIARTAEQLSISTVFICPELNPSTGSNFISEVSFWESQPRGDDWRIICGIGSVGSMNFRRGILDRFRHLHVRFTTIVSPSATVDPSTKIEEGVFIGPGAIITNDAHIGAHTIINTGAIIEHDSIIGSNAHVASGALILGGASIGMDSLIGGNATVLQGIKIGRNSLLGAGSVCVKNIPDDGGTWVGVPARKMR